METSLKRPLEQDSEVLIKRSKIEHRSILDFSDCVLLNILSYLIPYDLYCLSKTCTRFNYLIQDRKLWKRLDVLHHPMCAKKFKFFFKNLNSATDTIMVSGISKKEKALTFSQFIKLNKICKDLTVLAIENQYINSDEIGLKHFPETLKELSLRGTHIYGRQPFLQDAHVKLEKLHTLILADCKWFHEHSLMALSKLKSLENLSLYKCANLNDSVAYMSITAKFGFRKLRRIDARHTSVGDQFLKCFHCVKTLREIYLEAVVRRPRRQHQRLPRAAVLDQLHRLVDAHHQEIRPEPQNAAPGAVQHVVGANGASAVVFSSLQWRDRLKSPRKQKKPVVPHIQQQRDPTFNCLENCKDCSMATCSFMPQTTSGSSNTANQYNGKLLLLLLNNPTVDDESESSNENSSMEQQNESTEKNSEQESLSSFQISQQSSSTFSSPASSSSIKPENNLKSKKVNKSEDGTSNINEEMLYCDDVSDTEDEEDAGDDETCPSAALLELEMMQADVTDAGVQWFMGATPDTEDPPGELSVLFKPPYNSAEDDSQQNDTSKSQKASSAVRHDLNKPAGPPPPPPPPPPAPAPPPRIHGRVIIQNQRRRGRDLRVIIERLDPGLHIVYDGGEPQHYTTRLKVLICRGYRHITDAALRSLCDLRLELLDVRATNVTPVGVQDFLNLNPDCRLLHDHVT